MDIKLNKILFENICLEICGKIKDLKIDTFVSMSEGPSDQASQLFANKMDTWYCLFNSQKEEFSFNMKDKTRIVFVDYLLKTSENILKISNFMIDKPYCDWKYIPIIIDSNFNSFYYWESRILQYGLMSQHNIVLQ